MSIPTRHGRARPARLTLVLVAALAAVGLTACGSSDAGKSDAASSPKADNSAAAKLPSSVKSAGELVVAVDPTFPPSGFYGPGKKLVGSDVDLARALAGELGLKANVVATSFDSIIPGIQAGKYDLGMSLVNVTAQRKKTLDFVGYFQNGSSIMAPASGSLTKDAGLDDLCGKGVAVQRAAVQVTIAKTQSKKCTSAGKPAVKVQVFPDYNSATLAITSGRSDAGLFDQTNAAYTAKQAASKLKVVGRPIGQTPCGIAMKKGTGLAAAVQAALGKLIAKGTYKKVLAKYGLQDGGVTAATVNPAV